MRINKILCLGRNIFRFCCLPHYAQNEIHVHFIQLVTIICNDIRNCLTIYSLNLRERIIPILIWKLFQQFLEAAFHYRKLYLSKFCVAIEKS